MRYYLDTEFNGFGPETYATRRCPHGKMLDDYCVPCKVEAREIAGCPYCKGTGMVAVRSRDGQYAFAGPVPDDARGYADADCWYCDSGPPP